MCKFTQNKVYLGLFIVVEFYCVTRLLSDVS